jgi:saccharopine dehydrogenase-like NADP-dependent oxidoreductase
MKLIKNCDWQYGLNYLDLAKFFAMPKIVVLGTGLVGSAIAVDLASIYEVTAIDINTAQFTRLKGKGVNPIQADLSRPGEITARVSGSDLVIGALPGHMGFQVLKEVILVGKNIVDISFMPEDYFQLHELAKNHKVTAVVDCGVAPGMGNVILGYHNRQMEVESFRCYVGGLPVEREWPYEYKAVFSPIDVIEEYTRPARFVENHKVINRDALSDLELVELPVVGTLEAWNSDGLRSLLTTMDIPNMIEKTLRYPGTTEYIRVLRETGFFSYDEINIGGKKIRPIDVTAKLLFPKWKLQEGERDLTLMKIIITGKEKGTSIKYVYNLYDEHDKETGTNSMSRTTGYTCTAVANLILEGKFNHKGVCPPEFVGQVPGNFELIRNYLAERNVVYEVERTKH